MTRGFEASAFSVGLRVCGALVVAVLAIIAGAAVAHASPCKPNGQQCPTSMSCCSRNCVKPRVARPPLFGICCPTGTTVVNGACCTPNCTNRNCGSDGCGGSCGSCAMSECDMTIGMCVSCIPDGDAGCAGPFDCCSQACGADGVCESTTTTSTVTTSTASTTTTTTLAASCDVTGDNCQANSCGNACLCVTTTEGTPACVGAALCNTMVFCTSSAECNAGDKCVLNSCCGAPGACLPPCGTPTCTCRVPG
jgi:hypothetical protein